MKALIFDVDGTLAETEDLHRQSFNSAFRELGLPWVWDPALNRELLAVSGGFERMTFFQQRLPVADRVGPDLLLQVQAAKRRFYADQLALGALELRPGVQDLLETAKAIGLDCAVVTAASAASFEALAIGVLHASVSNVFDIVVTGDDVTRKKPDPQGYRLALDWLGIAPQEALVFEDSPVGQAAAVAAGLNVIVTPSSYGPENADFGDALVLPSLERRFWGSFGFPPSV